MERARIVCRCSTCLQVYQDGCSFSSSGYQNHIQVMNRKTAGISLTPATQSDLERSDFFFYLCASLEINARDYFADDDEMGHVFAEGSVVVHDNLLYT